MLGFYSSKTTETLLDRLGNASLILILIPEYISIKFWKQATEHVYKFVIQKTVSGNVTEALLTFQQQQQQPVC